MNATAEFLRHVEIFSLLENAELDALIERLHTRDVEGGSLIFEEGEGGSELFIVQSGRVSVSVRLNNGLEQEIAEFRAGDFFGEMSIFEDAPRSASCRTKQKSTLLSLLKEDFYRLTAEHPQISIKLMHKMLSIITWRLRNTSEFVSDMVEWGEEARRRAITDELTGVYNRRFLDEALESYFTAARDSGKPISLIMVDLDHFREINEAYGPKAGDRTLIAAVSAFKRVLREKDVIARYGGDEFTIILPETGLRAAGELAEKMRREIACGAASSIPLDTGNSEVRVTTSQGVAAFPDNGWDIRTVKEKADEALYRAKEAGRNRVMCADPVSV
jgi:diguanylate cyclase (GGDEF)-like protein